MRALQRRAAAYFGLQAAATTGWWIMLWAWPELRTHFMAPSQTEEMLLAFWLPDLILVVLPSLTASWLIVRGHPAIGRVLWSTTGAVSYAALYCLSLSLQTDGAWLSTILMLPAMLLTGCFALALSGHRETFRRARPGPRSWNVAKTVVQIAVVWGTTLLLLPMGIVAVQSRLGWPFLATMGQVPIGGLLFVAFSSLGLWSGYAMASQGDGTPLPLDAPRRLVITGPYAYVRNPMALAGLGQGLAVTVMTGSILMVFYVILGGVIWQWIVRPVEEEDMAATFGAEFAHYRDAVRCWCPRAQPYCEAGAGRMT